MTIEFILNDIIIHNLTPTNFHWQWEVGFKCKYSHYQNPSIDVYSEFNYWNNFLTVEKGSKTSWGVWVQKID